VVTLMVLEVGSENVRSGRFPDDVKIPVYDLTSHSDRELQAADVDARFHYPILDERRHRILRLVWTDGYPNEGWSAKKSNGNGYHTS